MKDHKKIEDKFIDYIDNNLPKSEIKLVENHLKSSEENAKEVAEMEQLFKIIASDKNETPSEKLQLNFNTLLSEEKEKLATETKIVQLEPKQDWRQYLRIVASIAIVISAFLLGKYQPNTHSQLANKQTEKTKQILAMLGNESASKRIQAIDISEEISKPDNAIIEALVSRLFNDENTNVRLASAEALGKFSSSETVRNALIKALETDIEPTVQIELIQILVKIQEKRALEPMQELLKKEKTPEFLKQELQNNIASLL